MKCRRFTLPIGLLLCLVVEVPLYATESGTAILVGFRCDPDDAFQSTHGNDPLGLLVCQIGDGTDPVGSSSPRSLDRGVAAERRLDRFDSGIPRHHRDRHSGRPQDLEGASQPHTP